MMELFSTVYKLSSLKYSTILNWSIFRSSPPAWIAPSLAGCLTVSLDDLYGCPRKHYWNSLMTKINLNTRNRISLCVDEVVMQNAKKTLFRLGAIRYYTIRYPKRRIVKRRKITRLMTLYLCQCMHTSFVEFILPFRNPREFSKTFPMHKHTHTHVQTFISRLESHVYLFSFPFVHIHTRKIALISL